MEKRFQFPSNSLGQAELKGCHDVKVQSHPIFSQFRIRFFSSKICPMTKSGSQPSQTKHTNESDGEIARREVRWFLRSGVMHLTQMSKTASKL